MPLTYLVDENIRGRFAVALRRAAIRLGFPLDVVEIGGADGPPMGTVDADLLDWVEAAGRIVVSLDGTTLPDHLADHLSAGRSCPGIILLRRGSWATLTEHLVLIAFATEAEEWRDRITYVP